jgi:hypothetical protein
MKRQIVQTDKRLMVIRHWGHSMMGVAMGGLHDNRNSDIRNVQQFDHVNTVAVILYSFAKCHYWKKLGRGHRMPFIFNTTNIVNVQL